MSFPILPSLHKIVDVEGIAFPEDITASQIVLLLKEAERNKNNKIIMPAILLQLHKLAKPESELTENDLEQTIGVRAIQALYKYYFEDPFRGEEV